MLDDGYAIAEACAAHLGLPDASCTGHGEDEAAFGRMLRGLEDPSLPPSTFTDITLAILFALSRRFVAETLLAVGAYRGVGARAVTVGRLSVAEDWPVEELLCDIDPECAGHLKAHRLASLAAFEPSLRERLAAGYVSRISHTPAPEVIAEMPTSHRYFALIDLDSPETGKAGYSEVARQLINQRSGSGLIVFHDVSVPRFSEDIARLEATLSEAGISYIALPVDDCGLGVAYVA